MRLFLLGWPIIWENFRWRKLFVMDLAVKVVIFVGAMHRLGSLVRRLFRDNNYSLLKIPRAVGYVWLTSGI